jgi:hypothetical protein
MAVEHLLLVPFPFRRQLNQRVFSLMETPRPSGCELIDDEIYRLAVHGWFLLYQVDDATQTITVLTFQPAVLG